MILISFVCAEFHRSAVSVMFSTDCTPCKGRNTVFRKSD